MQTYTKAVDNDQIRDAAKLVCDQQIAQTLLRREVPDEELLLAKAYLGWRELAQAQGEIEASPAERKVFELSWSGEWNHVKHGYEARKARRDARSLKSALAAMVGR